MAHMMTVEEPAQPCAAAGDQWDVAADQHRSRPRPARQREFSTSARAERHGVVVCQASLVVVRGRPGDLGVVPHDDFTAWFYGTLSPSFSAELEQLAAAARAHSAAPAVEPVDLILQGDGGQLALTGCELGVPVRYAGPANTLEYRLSHPGVAAEGAARIAA